MVRGSLGHQADHVACINSFYYFVGSVWPGSKLCYVDLIQSLARSGWRRAHSSGHRYAVSHVSSIRTRASLARPHFCDDTRTRNWPNTWRLSCDAVVVALGFLRECTNWDPGMFVWTHFSVRA